MPENANEQFTAPALRDESDRYSRQHDCEIDTEVGVAVVGLGGVGSWVAYFLAKAGVSRMVLFDSDTVSLTNLHRLPLEDEAVGQTKSEAVRDLCRLANPEGEYDARANFTPSLHENTVGNINWLVCSTDSLKSRKMCHDFCKKHWLRYIEAGAEGCRGSISGSPADFSTDLEEVDGYAVTPVFVGPCVMAASMAVYHILKDTLPTGTNVVDWPAYDDQGRYELVLRRLDV